MHFSRPAATLFILLGMGLPGLAQRNSAPDQSATHGTASHVSIEQLPLVFEPNLGQGPSNQAFLTRSGALQAGFSAGVIRLRLPVADHERELDAVLVGASNNLQITASEKGSGESNYLVGNQPSAWKTHIPQYAHLTYQDVYPGVNLMFYGTGGRLEHDFVVQPGADYRQIRMRYQCARKMALSTDGDLHVAIDGGELLVRSPLIYQQVLGKRQLVTGTFALLGDNEVGFSVGAFDPALPLTIDPVLDYSTYLANTPLYVYSAATDAAGNTYIVGQAPPSSDPVTDGAPPTACSACAPGELGIFITKLNSAGTAQVYSTFLGGSAVDRPAMIAVDAAGDAIVTGYTESPDFPLKNPISSGKPSYLDGFVTSIAPDGASLNFSSRLGGSASLGQAALTYGEAVAVDPSGNVYVTGTTESSYLPVTSGALNAGVPSYSAGSYVFLTKLEPSGSLVYSALVGAIGEAPDCCSVSGIALDSAGNAYLAGTAGVNNLTSATPWTTTPGAYQSDLIAPGQTAPFVAKISADGSKLIYSTLAATGITTSMALTAEGQVILVGTPDDNYQVTSNAYSSTAGSIFIAELSADGTRLPYSTYFSTPTEDMGGIISKVTLDGAGDVWVAGRTHNINNVPMVNPLQSLPGAQSGSAFVSEFDPSMRELLFSTYFDGVLGGSRIGGLAVDPQGRVHIAGTAQSDLPTTPSAFLDAVTPPAKNYASTFGFAALIDPNVPAPAICFSSPSTAQAQVGSSGQSFLSITNCGSGPLTISAVQVSSPAFSVPPSSSCIGRLSAGAACTVTATFTPTVAGIATALVTVTSSAPIPVNIVPVAGNGTAPRITVEPSSSAIKFAVSAPQVTLSSSSVRFGSLPVGFTSVATTVTVKNSGKGALTGLSLAITGANAASFSEQTTCAASLAAGASCTVGLNFAPVTSGALQASLALTDNAAGSPQAVSLTGTGTLLTPTLAFAYIPSHAFGDSPFTVSAKSQSSGVVTYSISSGPAIVSGATVTITGVEAIVLKASQAAAGKYAAATATASFTVSRGVPAIAWATPASIAYGTLLGASQLDASATVTGKFAYSPAAGTLLNPGLQTLSVTFTPATAADYNAAKATVTLTVTKAPQTITFAPLPASVAIGASPLMLSAKSSSGLALTFSATGPATVSGSTLTFTGAGSVVLTANQAGNSDYSPAAISQTIIVTRITPTALLTSSAATVTYGASVTFTAALSGSGAKPTGTVTFLNGTAALGTGTLNSSGVAMLAVTTLPGGAGSITASYSGDSQYAQITSAPLKVTVSKAIPAVTLTPSASSTSYGSSITLTAVLSGAGTRPTGSVTFLIGPVALGTGALNSNGIATLGVTSLPMGNDSITASYGGDGNYSAAFSAAAAVTVNKTAQTITFKQLAATATYGASPLVLTATVNSGLQVAFSISGPATVSVNELIITGAGTIVITASQAGNAIYAAAPVVSQTIKVSKATPAITWPAPAAVTVGTTLSSTQLDAVASVPGVFTYKPAAGTVLSTAGTVPLSAAFAPTNSAGYNSATASVTLTVSAPPGAVPAIASISAASAPAGWTETITGTNFGASQGTSTVNFGSTAAAVLAWSKTSILATVPQLPVGAAGITVNEAGTASGAASFQVVAGQSTCATFGTISIDSGEYIYQQDEWDSSLQQCAVVNGAGFTLTTAAFDQTALGSNAPAAYASIFWGCHWGDCSATGSLPIQLSHLASASTSVNTTEMPTGNYDVAYDIWFNQTAQASGQPNGTEVMIWINHNGTPQPYGTKTATETIDGVSWEVWTGVEGSSPSWNVISYVLTPATSSVTNLALVPFFTDAVSRGSLQDSWYLIDIEMGFEVWDGGLGLEVSNFSASATAK